MSGLIIRPNSFGTFYGNFLLALIVVAAIMIALNSALTFLATKVRSACVPESERARAPSRLRPPTPAVSVPGMDLTKP